MRECIPVTGGQSSLFFAEQRSASGCAYNLPTVLEIGGRITDQELLAAGERLLRHTPGLRVRLGIDADTGRVVQWIDPEVPEVEYLQAPADDPRPMADIALDLARSPFEPDEGALARVVAVRRGPEHAALVAVTHHLVIDGISHPALARRLGDAVAGTLTEQPDSRYRDVVRHVLFVQEEAVREDREHWYGRLPDGAGLPTWNQPPLAGGQSEGCTLTTMTPANTNRLEAAADRAQSGLFGYLLAAVHHALPVSGGDVTPVCAAASVRPRDGASDDVVGCFINEVPLLAEVDATAGVGDLARRHAEGWRVDLRRRGYPLVDLASRVTRADPVTDMQLNSVTVSYRRTPGVLSWSTGPLSFTADLYPRYPTAKNELCVRFFHHADHLRYEVQWGRGLPSGLGGEFVGRLDASLADAG